MANYRLGGASVGIGRKRPRRTSSRVDDAPVPEAASLELFALYVVSKEALSRWTLSIIRSPCTYRSAGIGCIGVNCEPKQNCRAIRTESVINNCSAKYNREWLIENDSAVLGNVTRRGGTSIIRFNGAIDRTETRKEMLRSIVSKTVE